MALTIGVVTTVGAVVEEAAETAAAVSVAVTKITSAVAR